MTKIRVTKAELQKVDDLIPKYKKILDDLPKNERRVLAAFLEFGCPIIITRQIAKRARLNVNKTSVHLKRLEEKGIITSIDYKNQRSWSIIDLFFHTYYLCRQGEYILIEDGVNR